MFDKGLQIKTNCIPIVLKSFVILTDINIYIYLNITSTWVVVSVV